MGADKKMKAKSTTERTYSTVLLEAGKPVDLSMFCEMIAKQMLTDAEFIHKERKTNE